MIRINIISLVFYFITVTSLFAQDDPNTPAVDKAALRVVGEEDYYPIVTIAVPSNILVEVGGMATLPDGRLAVATRRGDVWMIENPSSYLNGQPTYTLYASGLHEPLGCVYKDNALYIAQRGELTKLADDNGDGRADVYETVYAWPLSGHYHEYSYGPALADDGSFFVTANVAFGDQEWWRGESRVPMRGWTMNIRPDGTMQPWATGMRSPCGIGMIDGEFFYDDNQGDYMGSGGIWHVKKGSFTGHPAGLVWADKVKKSPISLTQEKLFTVVSERKEKNEFGNYVKPENKEIETPQLLSDVKVKFPEVQTPAVWLPHGILGISNAEIKVDKTEGKFGPFNGQVFVGDQGQSKIMRIFLEKINGEYQGAAFDFRNDFQSGILRMDWASDGSLYVGQTNRGWGSSGEKNEGLQRVIWSGKIPFEMKTVKAMPDGFEIEFTKPADVKSLKDLNSYSGSTFLYKYHPVYGSPPVNKEQLKISGVKVSDDGMKVRIVIVNTRKNYIHELILAGVKDLSGNTLLHPTSYYTLNNIPDGIRLDIANLSTSSPSKSIVVTEPDTKSTTPKSTPKTKTIDKPKAATVSAPTTAEITPLLKKYTCAACHNAQKRQVGPSYKDIAKRGYTDEKMVQLIYKPNPKNWPEYATEMAPMPQVPKADALKIAAWINGIK
jgi:cytochrome c551/c552